LSAGNVSLSDETAHVPEPLLVEDVVISNETNFTTITSTITTSTTTTTTIPTLPPEPVVFNVSDYPGANYTPVAAFLPGDAGAWDLRISTADMAGGQHYQLCTDSDGEGPLLVGDTGFSVFVSPITAVAPSRNLLTGTNDTLALYCERGGCGFLDLAFLAKKCEAKPEDICVPPVPVTSTTTAPVMVFEDDDINASNESNESNESNASNDSNDSNESGELNSLRAASEEGMPDAAEEALIDSNVVQLDGTPAAPVVQQEDEVFSVDLELGCTRPGNYRLCLVSEGGIVEDSAFAIVVV